MAPDKRVVAGAALALAAGCAGVLLYKRLKTPKVGMISVLETIGALHVL